MREENGAYKLIDPAGAPDLTSARALWMLLCGLVAFLSWVTGLSTPLALMILLLAAPAVIGVVAWKSGSDWAGEIETASWVLVATASAAVTGGANSTLNILFMSPMLLALAAGRTRLAAEAVVLGLLGFAASAGFAAYGFSGLTDFDFTPAPQLMTGAALVLTTALVLRWRTHILGAVQVLRRERDQQADARRSLATRYSDVKRESETMKNSIERRTGFFAQTSHELRTPLNAILGFSEAMKVQLFGPLPERYREYAELIHEGGKYLQVIVDDVLDLSKIEAGRYQISPMRISLSDVLADAVTFMGDQAKREAVTLRVVSTKDNVEALADPRAVRQVALNLISNAIKYAPRGGEVTVKVEQRANGGLLRVRDTGPGLDQELFERLKQPFSQGGDASQQRNAPKGTGLGLSVAEAFMQLHGGKLELNPSIGSGAEILAFFPDP